MVAANPASPDRPAEARGGAVGAGPAKRVALGLAWLVVSPLVVLTRAEAALAGPTASRAFDLGKEALACAPGLAGCYLRSAYYASVCREVSPRARFCFGSMLAGRDVAIGEGTVIGAWSIVGRAEIGRDVLIASRVSVFSDRYRHGRPGDRSRGHGEARRSALVRVGDGCWIGENAVVMASIAERCTVAAGAVVMREAPAGCTLMGNPARKVNL